MNESSLKKTYIWQFTLKLNSINQLTKLVFVQNIKLFLTSHELCNVTAIIIENQMTES